VLFWSGIWYRKLIFLKIILKENFIYLKNVIWIYIYSGTPPASTTTHWTALNWSCSGAGVVASAVTHAFLKVSCIIEITSFLQFLL